MNGNESRSFGRALRALSGLVAAFAVGVVVAGAAPAAPPGGHGPPGGGGHDEATEEYVAPASLYRVGADGTDATRLTQGPGYNAWSDNNASVRSDGAIVFASTRPAADETVDAELWLLLPDGSLVQLTDNASAVSDETGEEEPINDVNPVFSPDGTMVAYQSAPVAVEGGSQAGSQIWILDVATKTPEQVTTFQASVGAAKHPTWSPDGTQLAFTVGDGRQMHIVRIDLATKALTDVTPRGSTDSMPAWSPTDADLIAYTRGMGSTMDVRLKNIATGAETVAAGTEEMESEPAWSPDGTKIAYQRGDESMGASIWLMNADGTGKTAVTTAVTWSDRDPAVAWDAETETISIVYESTFDAVPAANLSITKTGVPATAAPGQTVTYTIPVVNGGPLTATGVVVQDTLPVGLEYVSATATLAASEHEEEPGPPFTPVVSVAGQVVTVELGDLAKGEAGAVGATVTVVARTTSAGTFVNTAVVSLTPTEEQPDLIDPLLAGNTATASTVVTTAPVPPPSGDVTLAASGPPIGATPAPITPGSAKCTLVGTAGNDVLTGTPGRDVICGLGGDDVISGLGGNDLLVGGPGNDRLVGGAGNDVLNGQDGNDLVDGTTGNDVLYGGLGNDVLTHMSGKDKLYAGAGNDTLKARDGAYDWVNGGLGRDTATIDRKVDRLFSIESIR